MARRLIHVDDYEPIPGDVFQVYVDYGVNLLRPNESIPPRTFSIVLYDDYQLSLPFVSEPLNVSGKNLGQIRREALAALRQGLRENRLSALQLAFALTEASVFDVHVFGAVTNAGSATVNSLTSLVDLLETRSLLVSDSSRRRISLERDGQSSIHDVATYYSDGDNTQNPLLRPGDVIRIPRVAATAQISGAVRRPGVYEIVDGDTIGDIVSFAGGFLQSATREDIRLVRFAETGVGEQRGISYSDDSDLRLEPGDRLFVSSSASLDTWVVVEGAFYGEADPLARESGTQSGAGGATTLAASSLARTPDSPRLTDIVRQIPASSITASIAFRPGLTLLEVLELLGGPTPYALTAESYIERPSSGERIAVPRLRELWETSSRDMDVRLEAGDHIVVPIQDLEVRVTGAVASPGSRQYVPGRTVSDYVELAGGVDRDRGDPNAIFFQDAQGNRTPVALSAEVEPGSTIFVDTNAWQKTQQTFSDIFTVTGWVTGILGVAGAIINFIFSTLPQIQ